MKKIGFWQKCDIRSLEEKLSDSKDISVFKNVQAVYLKAKYKMNAESIAKITGFSKVMYGKFIRITGIMAIKLLFLAKKVEFIAEI